MSRNADEAGADERSPLDAREEPPLVTRLVISGMAHSRQVVRGAIRALDRSTALFLWGAGSLFVFLGILGLSIAQSPDAVGVLQGLAGGVMTALLFAVAVGWTLLWAYGTPKPTLPPDAKTVSALEEMLAPVLRELNAVRRDVIHQVKARSVVRVPLGLAAALALWFATQQSSDPPTVLELPLWLLIGAGAGEGWAAHKLDKDYRRLYKSRVLPRLARRLGDLTYQPASPDRVEKLRAHRVFGAVDTVHADDEIAGSYRGVSISIIEARLTRRSSNDTVVVFNGLVVQITLPRSLTGTTAIVTDEGVIGNLKAQWRTGALERVRLEDPNFEARYEVYSTDQIEARALLTPAFMQRFLALGSRSGFAIPGALAEGNRLTVALPKLGGRDLFEPPVYWKPAGGRVLLTLHEDISAVLQVAETIIDLDFWARGVRQ